MEKWEAEAIRRGWLYPRPVVRYEDVQQNPTRDTSIVTFKDWLESRGVVLDPYVSGFDQYHVSIDPGLRTGAPMTFVHFDEVPPPE